MSSTECLSAALRAIGDDYVRLIKRSRNEKATAHSIGGIWRDSMR